MTEAATFALKLSVQELYDAYVTCLDDDDLEAWPEFFTDDCFYQVIPRENWDRDLPLATLRCESKAMLRDRVVSLRETSFYAPRYTRHLWSALRITGTDDGVIRTQANYCVLETLVDEATKVLSAGRYIGLVVRDGERLRFKEKHCVFDSVVVPTSLVYPI
jgi:3-phenylpropionate/cinnamic acid dioxygenase small subunit